MGELLRIFILLTVIVLGDCSFSRTSFNPFPLGTIGCLVSDVCVSGEICVNDLLFGNCQSIFNGASDEDIKVELSTNAILRLEDEIAHLLENGFTWKDAITQCTLQNVLLEFRSGLSFNRYLCQETLEPTLLGVPKDANGKLERHLLQMLETDKLNLPKVSDEPSKSKSESDLLNSKKRDEIVQIHKYFDKSSGLFKRDPYSGERSYFYQNNEPAPYSLYDFPDFLSEHNKQIDYNPFLVSDGHRYWMANVDPKISSYNSDLASSYSSDLMPPTHKETMNTLQDSMELQDSPDHPNIKDTIEVLALAPGDEGELEEVLKGKLSPRDLSIKQQKHLQTFIKGLIQVLEDNGRDTEQSGESGNVVEDTAPYKYKEVKIPKVAAKVDNTDPPSDNVADLNDYMRDDYYHGKPHDLMNAKFSSKHFRTDVQPRHDGETEKDNTEEYHCEDVDSVCLQLSKEVDMAAGEQFVQMLQKFLKLPSGLLDLNKVGPGRMISLKVGTDPLGKWNAENIAKEVHNINIQLKKTTGIIVQEARAGQDGRRVELKRGNRYVVLTLILMSSTVGAMLVAAIVYKIKQHCRSQHKVADITHNAASKMASLDYQDLCRQCVQGKSPEKPKALRAVSWTGSASENQDRSPSSRSSTSSWGEEPVSNNMDILTGHVILSYMEDHLKNKDRLSKEWEAVTNYVPDPSTTMAASEQSNIRKNRYSDNLPYDHSRVLLSSIVNVSNSDYINASFITDHNPRSPAYICTQGPLPHTVADFWQMVWEQGSVVIVMLTRLTEKGENLCHRYWPEQGSDLYHIYEVHLVSEHIWSDDYVVRNFYLKNLQTNETRTVTQFYFLTWPEHSVPASIKALLDFRRKVNKSFRGRSCPIVVHCSDGCGRSGTYCLIDMVLNKMSRGTKEIDMAATLEHLRDQRMSMIRTKEQFQFSLAAVAEEVNAILRALPQ